MKIKILDQADLITLALEKLETITLETLPSAETIAMLQALYSRSPTSVEEHLEKVLKVGAKSFMETYYIGYGHDSIGQCGTTTVFIEGVSFLAAKAIQSDQFYNGQEASTRYMDFSKASWTNPFPCPETEQIFQTWLEFYKKVTLEMFSVLQEQCPKPPEVTEDIYVKTLKAKVFDIARGFLPCGLQTNLSWHGTLNGLQKHLKVLAYHPLEEVQKLAWEIYKELHKKYPSSFPKTMFRSDEEELYFKEVSELTAYSYFNFSSKEKNMMHIPFCSQTPALAINKEEVADKLLKHRVKRTRLPKVLDFFGNYIFNFSLDFGSFRDLQRHRQTCMPMPVVNISSLSSWYLEQLSPKLKEEALFLFEAQLSILNQILRDKNISSEELQNFGILANTVFVTRSVSLPQAVYEAELRSGQSVHPTLRRIAQRMAFAINADFPEMPLYVDLSEDKLSFSRGKQDIIEK